jgi:hypothetical protein
VYARMRRLARRGAALPAAPALHGASAAPAHRLFASVLALFVAAMGTIVFPASPAAASSGSPVPAALAKQLALCSVQEWQADFKACVDRLADVSAQRVQCLKAPIPDAPDSGLAGWFASAPTTDRVDGAQLFYSNYGYAGYSYTTYDIGCTPVLMHPDYKFENTVANGEFMLATGVIGASNALRERAWDPGRMWGWADPLVEKATKATYERVFSVFGAVTLAIVGVYLLWRSRQAEMSVAMTTAAWALLVMVVVTALASWPVFSAHLADKVLVSGLSVVHDAVGPPARDPADCKLADRSACVETRPPAVRASDTVTETMLYRNYLRGLLGSADSTTAKKYGKALYDSRSLSWREAEDIRLDPKQRDIIMQRKSEHWMKIAEQIKTEDPEAYEYLTGTRGMDRIGAGFIALLASVLFAMFDLTASLLVLLGFLIFRWAVIAAPILGTVAILRPASAGFRRLMNAVVAAIFNIIIFGTGAAIYLFAVDVIMGTATLPGWLQVVLVWLVGVVGWLLLRPYRRITQLGGRDSAATIASAGSWHRRFFRDVRDTAPLAAAIPATEATAGRGVPPVRRTENRPDGPDRPEMRPDGVPTPTGTPPAGAPAAPQRRMPAPSRGGGWREPTVAEPTPGYTVYRPSRSPVTAADDASDRGVPVRAEARRD